MKKNRSLKHPIYWPVWLGMGILWAVTRLPFSWQIKFGQGLGQLLYLFPSKLKRVTEINIKLCFPKLTAKEQRRLMKKNFSSIGIGLIETAMAWWLPDKRLLKLVEIRGLNYPLQAVTKNKGVILLSPHFFCLEIIGRLVSMQYTFTAMYRPHKKSLIAFIHERFRARYNLSYIPRHKMRTVIDTLSKGQPLWYAYDIDGGVKRSVFAPFFGIPTASLTAVSRLTQLTGATVVPVQYYRREDNKGYQVNFLPTLENFPSEDWQTDATRLNAVLEEAIRNHPEQYIWQYKRFKTRPAGEKRFY